jgi:hypothetical protein
MNAGKGAGGYGRQGCRRYESLLLQKMTPVSALFHSLFVRSSRKTS